jgi:hypothetical protein
VATPFARAFRVAGIGVVAVQIFVVVVLAVVVGRPAGAPRAVGDVDIIGIVVLVVAVGHFAGMAVGDVDTIGIVVLVVAVGHFAGMAVTVNGSGLIAVNGICHCRSKRCHRQGP